MILETGTYCLPVDFQVLQKCCANEELFAALLCAPQEALSCLGAAVYEVRVPHFLRISIMLNEDFLLSNSLRIAGLWYEVCSSDGSEVKNNVGKNNVSKNRSLRY